MKITFETPKEVVIVKEIKRTIAELTIEEIVDNNSRKEVKAYTEELGIVTLWTGTAYDAIGQWTDADVVARVKELYK
jgi:hypothetical protein